MTPGSLYGIFAPRRIARAEGNRFHYNAAGQHVIVQELHQEREILELPRQLRGFSNRWTGYGDPLAYFLTTPEFGRGRSTLPHS